jgi:DNA polymerase/3'-5' exonuclease PolX
VRSGDIQLTREQLIGLDCYEDLQEEMEREEVESIGKLVIDACRDTNGTPAEATIMGSFRRGKSSSGDVDVLITMKDHPDRVPRNALPGLIENLCQQGHVAHHITQLPGIYSKEKVSLTSSPPRKKHRFESASKPYKSCKSYMGVFFSPKYPGKRRRVDIKIYPYNQKAFASLCKYMISTEFRCNPMCK